MPKAAIERGAADSVFPMAGIPGAILRRSAAWVRVKE
jgi:chemotaxis response regulator CheB